jgi:hypothetical protein
MMSKKVLRFLEALECAGEEHVAEHALAGFIRELTGYEDPVDAAELNGQLDQLINLSKQAKNLLKPHRSIDDDESTRYSRS